MRAGRVPAVGLTAQSIDLSFRDSNQQSSTFSLSIGFTGHNTSELRQQYDALERQARTLSDQLRKPLPDPATGEKLRSQLRDAVSQAFETRQKLQRAELAEFAKRLQGIQQSIEMREKISQQIIDRRVQELLDPNVKWEQPSVNGSSTIQIDFGKKRIGQIRVIE